MDLLGHVWPSLTPTVSFTPLHRPLLIHSWNMDLGADKGAGAARQGVVRWVKGLASSFPTWYKAYMACRK